MVATSQPLAIYNVAESLRLCASEWLENTPEGTPDRSCVVAGQIAWDDCECGQLIVSIGRNFFSSNFPTEGNTPPAPPGNARGCGPPLLVAEFIVSILRCAPSGGEGPAPPACSELDTAAQSAVHDAWAVRWGVHCCLKSWAGSNDQEVSIADFILRGQSFVGPQGMCMGSELNVVVGIINACPPCDRES